MPTTRLPTIPYNTEHNARRNKAIERNYRKLFNCLWLTINLLIVARFIPNVVNGFSASFAVSKLKMFLRTVCRDCKTVVVS